MILGTVRYYRGWVASSVALYIIAAYWFTSSTSFANPPITVARSLTNTFAGIARQDVPWFIIAQLFGAASAAVLTKWLFDRQYSMTGQSGRRARMSSPESSRE